jgi:hypothetical protein
MELQYKIQRALRFIDRLSGKERETLRNICFEIQSAQAALNAAAVSYFQRCLGECRGICCKNINVNDVVTLLDLVYILSMKGASSDQIFELAESEELFSADCLFLRDGQGPCFFPADIKPERCIITFCGETRPIRKELKAIRSKFSKLSRFTKSKRPFLWIRS